MISKPVRQAIAASRSSARCMKQALLLWLLSATCSALAADISLQTDTTLSQEGYLVLSWQTVTTEADAAMLVLQQARTADFSNVAELAVPSTGTHTVTGLANGGHVFRVGSTAEGWSNTVSVRVVHHSLAQAWLFFTLGLLLFLILCGVIFTGTHKAKGHSA